MTDTQFMKAYTIKEVSKKINVPSGTIRQWEKDLAGLLVVPRTKQGARFYTDIEIDQLMKIKHMRDKNLSKDMIRELLQRHMSTEPFAEQTQNENSLTVKTNMPAPPPEDSQNDYGAFMMAMEQYKKSLLEEVKAEIRNGIRKEVLEEVKKEISKEIGRAHV